MSVLDQAKAVLKTKQGKVIAVAGLGGLAWLYWTRGRSAGAATDDPGEVTTADRVPPAGAGATGDSNDSGRPKTNQDWIDQAVSRLMSPPHNKDSLAVYNALRKALDGLMVSSGEQQFVSLAIQLLGPPPEGMPPLNASPPAGGGGGGGGRPGRKPARIPEWNMPPIAGPDLPT